MKRYPTNFFSDNESESIAQFHYKNCRKLEAARKFTKLGGPIWTSKLSWVSNLDSQWIESNATKYGYFCKL